MFPVSPEKAQALRARLARLGVREADLDEQFVRSGGHGGQNVNKVATCVVLRHAPSGIVVSSLSARAWPVRPAARHIASGTRERGVGIEKVLPSLSWLTAAPARRRRAELSAPEPGGNSRKRVDHEECRGTGVRSAG